LLPEILKESLFNKRLLFGSLGGRCGRGIGIGARNRRRREEGSSKSTRERRDERTAVVGWDRRNIDKIGSAGISNEDELGAVGAGRAGLGGESC